LHGGTIALFLCCWLMLVSDVCSFLLSFPCLIGAVVVCIGMISIDLYWLVLTCTDVYWLVLMCTVQSKSIQINGDHANAHNHCPYQTWKT
jgi:hypothetical protein